MRWVLAGLRKAGEGVRGKGEGKKAWRTHKRDASDRVKFEQKHRCQARFNFWIADEVRAKRKQEDRIL